MVMVKKTVAGIVNLETCDKIKTIIMAAIQTIAKDKRKIKTPRKSLHMTKNEISQRTMNDKPL